MKATIKQPSPFHLPGATIFPSREKDGEVDHLDWDCSDFGDTGSIDSLSTISTTFEAADDMLDFVIGFDYPCVVVYFLDSTYHRAYHNALQPYWYNNVFNVINTSMANDVMNRLERHQHVPLLQQGRSIIHQSIDSPRQRQGDHFSFEQRPAFQEVLSDYADEVPLPTYLVRPRKGSQFPAMKRSSVRSLITPLPDTPAFIPPVYVSVPNPMAHQDNA